MLMILSTLLFFSSQFETPLEDITLRKMIHIGSTILLPVSALICTCRRSPLNSKYVLYKGKKKRKKED